MWGALRRAYAQNAEVGAVGACDVGEGYAFDAEGQVVRIGAPPHYCGEQPEYTIAKALCQ